MTKERFWVVGGKFQDMGFSRLHGAPEVFGPFDSRLDAHAEWRRLTAQSTAAATVRFSIAAERQGAAA